MLSNKHLRGFTDRIWDWYTVHKRVLPWRDLWHESEEVRAYKVLVSEVMLQQTQVTRVTVLFPEFLKKFSTIGDLARASNREMILAWRGMGYNRRALQLRDAAKHIVRRAGNPNHQIPRPTGAGRANPKKVSNPKPQFPKEMQELLVIPGIGPYTAAAIRNFAFDLPTPCLDTNIRRVLHRAFVKESKADDQYLLQLAKDVLEVAIHHYPSQTIHYPAADWHHALMDYGSLVEKAKKGRRPPFAKASGDKKEPGRLVESRYVPNRIFRGKIIEELRDERQGLMIDQIGVRICSDWDAKEHREWLTMILEKLKKDALVMEKRKKYLLRE